MQINDRPRYYKRDGTPYPNTSENEALFAWAKDLENLEYKRVEWTEIGNVQVSTVWLGLDHSFGIGDKPLIFETMIFGGIHGGYQERYSTEEEAQEGHRKAVAIAQKGRSPIERVKWVFRQFFTYIRLNERTI